MSNMYKRGKIYQIIDNTNGNYYIGSTHYTLNGRLCDHVHQWRRGRGCIAREIFKNGDYTIKLIELYPCNDKYELEEREKFYIKGTNCINKKWKISKTPPLITSRLFKFKFS
jgi:hypothetical protein